MVGPPKVPRRARHGAVSCGARAPGIALALAALFTLASSTGCAIIGAYVGSTIPKYEPLPQEPIAEQASLGQRIHVVRASDGEELSGRYDGVYDEQLWIRARHGTYAVPTRDVKSARIASGDHWLEGFLVGLTLDVATIAIVGSNIHHLFPEDSSSYHVGADGVNVAGR